MLNHGGNRATQWVRFFFELTEEDLGYSHQMSWAFELILISAKIYCQCGVKVCCTPSQNFPAWSSLIPPVVYLQWLTGMHVTAEMVTNAVQTENIAHQYLLSFGRVSRQEIQKNGKVKIPTPKKNRTKPKSPKLWLIINVKCQSLKLSFFSCAWVQKGEVPSEDDFIFYFWVWRSWMWFGKFIKILWWSWVAIWKWYIQRYKKAWGENCRCWKKNQQCTWMRLKIADN